MLGIREENKNLPPLRSTDIRQKGKGENVIFAGVKPVFQRPSTAFLTMKDELGYLDFIIPKDVHEKFREVLENYHIYILRE